MAAATNARIPVSILNRLIILRPGVRESVFSYLSRNELTASQAKVLASCACSGHLVDDASLVDLVNNLVETKIKSERGHGESIGNIIDYLDNKSYYGVYSGIWLRSKYGDPLDLLEFVDSSESVWISDNWLGRLVGGIAPLFMETEYEHEYKERINHSRNAGVREAYKFHAQLSSDLSTFRAFIGH